MPTPANHSAAELPQTTVGFGSTMSGESYQWSNKIGKTTVPAPCAQIGAESQFEWKNGRASGWPTTRQVSAFSLRRIEC